MTTHRSASRPTIGLLAGWQIYGRTNRVNFLGPVLLGIRSAAQELGADLLLACGLGPDGGSLSRARPAWPAPSPDSDFVPVGPWNTDGLLVLNPLLSAERSAAVREMVAAGHPVVCIGAAEGGPAIAIENGGAIRQALEHLLAHGHRRIAFIAGNPEDLSGDGDERLRAYRAAVRDCGLPLDERLIAYGYHVTEGGRQARRELLDRAVHFTAVIASNDESAIGAVAVLREAGRAVPGDVAVVGMDDQPCALAHAPPLTTLHVPTFEMGYRAVRLLADVIAGRVDGAPVLRLPARLVVRQSCGCDAGAGLTLPAGVAQEAPPLADAVARAVLLGLQQLRLEDVALLAGRLVAAWRAGLEGDGWDAFRQTVAALAQRTSGAGDSAHAWQAALSQLRAGLAGRQDAVVRQALDVLDWARTLLSEQVQRQHRQHLVDQVQSAERIGLLTAQLQSALDEEQIYAALAGALPEAGVACVGIALFEPAGDDPVAWARLRRIGPGQPAELRFRSRAFPPPELLDEGAPAQLALFPLARGDADGVMIFASADLELCATIARQVGAAFRTVLLYREAVRGQRLAEEANRLKSHFLSIVSHELRTPLFNFFFPIMAATTPIVGKETAMSASPHSRPGRATPGWLKRTMLVLSVALLLAALGAASRATRAAPGLLAQNRPVTVSSSENPGVFPGSAAVDGSSGTRWASAFSDPQWIQIDLGSSQAIGRVVQSWEGAYGRTYQIQTSATGSTWTTIYSTTTGDGGFDDFAVSGSGRCIRLYGTGRGTGLRLFAVGAGSVWAVRLLQKQIVVNHGVCEGRLGRN